MPRNKTADARLRRPDSRIPHRPPELDAFVDQFLSAVCDTSRRYILELLAEPNDKYAGSSIPETAVLKGFWILSGSASVVTSPYPHVTLILFGNGRNTYL
ncbi:MAG: hypothetical protein E6I91_11085 [Chloroflexi bacterium]|nr:MAG: hypothetical protein E6I91_11085 [Chloroflexota bacterium]